MDSNSNMINDLLMMIELMQYEDLLAAHPEGEVTLLQKLRERTWGEDHKANVVALLTELECPKLLEVFKRI